eukprot:2539613-Rhodomonas_salina.1
MPLSGRELGARGKYWDDKKHKIAEETWFTIMFCIEDDPDYKARIERAEARCKLLKVWHIVLDDIQAVQLLYFIVAGQ